VVVSNGFDRIRRPYSIIDEFGTKISAGNKYGVPGIHLHLNTLMKSAKNYYMQGKIIFKFTVLSAMMGVFCLIEGCADLDKFVSDLDKSAKGLTNSVSYQDSVTGERTLGLMSEQQEIEQGEKYKDYCIQQYQAQGLLIDNDKETLEKIQTMLNNITKVSHRPNLPWEIHVVETKKENAFALPGGKVFVLKGIVGTLVKSDEELAGVIAHEVAHITCRHQVREQTWNIVMPMIQKRARKDIYKASYSALQEDEADRVGLLYMALAGYDPQAVYDIWKRADIAYGSNPGNYLYDHSLNSDRANKVSHLIPLARNYFTGEGVENTNYANLLLNNELVPRRGIQSDSGIVSVLDLGLNTYTQYLKTKNEQVKREQEKSRNESYLRFARVANVRKQPTADGHIGLFADVTNLSNILMKKAMVTVYYLDGANKVLYSEAQELSNIPSAGTTNVGFYLKNVPNYKNISMAVTNVEF